MRFYMRGIFTCLFCASLSSLLLTQPVRAQNVKDLSLHASESGNITILILDMSGSMAANDQRGLRCSAAKAYIEFSAEDAYTDSSKTNNYIGLVGLVNTDGTTEKPPLPHTFQLAQIWSQPVLVSDPQSLQDIIDQKSSNNCQAGPDGAATTPTYDALYQALQMLAHPLTQKIALSGSVIMLTDGKPLDGKDPPDTGQQIDAIQTELVPQFQAQHWPIYTVTLGNNLDQSFIDFLDRLSNATHGKMYNDSQGVVPGKVSPLNITSFFADIFARQKNRTLRPTLGPLSVNGEITSYPFMLDEYAQFLDVLVIKDPDDQSGMPVSLKDANGDTLDRSFLGVSNNTKDDPYYAFFSIQGPSPGQWSLTIGGNGEFALYSIITSELQVSILSPAEEHGSVQPAGQDLLIRAVITDQEGTPVLDGKFSLIATIKFFGTEEPRITPFMSRVILDKTNNASIFQKEVLIPQDASPGRYEITISASEASDVPLTDAKRQFTVIQVPQVALSSHEVTVVQWPSWLQTVYSFVPLLQWINQWWQLPLPQAPVALLGTIKNLPDTQATITQVTIAPKKPNIAVPIKVVSEKGEQIRLLIFQQDRGVYTITFTVYSVLDNTLEHFETSSAYTIHISNYTATAWQQAGALLLVILFIVIMLALLRYLYRFCSLSFPFGMWMREEDGEPAYYPMCGWHIWHILLIKTFFRRGILLSRQVGMPAGLQFRFRCIHGKRMIEVRAYGQGHSRWKLQEDNQPVPERFSEVQKLVYIPEGNAVNLFEPVYFTLFP